MIMELKLTELTKLDDVLKLYDVYKDCMYMPTYDKFERKMSGYLADDNTHIYACCTEDKTVGAAVCSCAENCTAEIVGIGVDSALRCNGIGLYIVNKIKENHSGHTLYAETDDDAVGFYRRCGFSVMEYMQNYDGQAVRRYKCTL